MRPIALILGCALYVISPIDLWPEFLGGFIDDIVAVAITVRSLAKGKRE